MNFKHLTQLTLLIESLSDSGFLMTEAVKLAKELQDIFKKYDLEVPEEISDVKEVKLKDKDLLKVFDGRKEQDLKMGKVLLKLFPNLDQKTLLQIVGEIKAESSDDIEFTVEKDVVKAYTEYCIDSCMTKSGAKKQLYFYTTQPDISIVIARKDGKPVGRALLWSKVEGAKNDMFMDRIYPADDEMIVAKFHKYAIDNGWSHRKTQSAENTDENVSMIYDIQNKDKLIDIGFPYMDTFRYGETGTPMLTNNPYKIKNISFIQKLTSTTSSIILFHSNEVELTKKLMMAADSGDIKLIQSLLKDGVNVNAKHGYALRKNATRGRFDVVKFLLDAGADIHIDDDYALRLAAFEGHLDVVKLLIDRGADVNVLGGAPIYSAVAADKIDVVKMLLAAGAKINNDAPQANNVLHRAASDGCTYMIRLLLASGANVHANNDSALQIASEIGHNETVKLLLDNGANPTTDNNYALRRASQFGNTKIVEMLLVAGADVHAQKDDPLYLAIRNENVFTVIALLNAVTEKIDKRIFEYLDKNVKNHMILDAVNKYRKF